jgi:divalent metal cation (Fe/Co/Zn/Cd) transporter
VSPGAALPAVEAPVTDDRWLRDARRAQALSYLSLVWMLIEGAVGVIAGVQARSVGVLAWAIGSAVEALAAVIVIVRFTGARRFSESAERTAQRWLAASFFVLVPYIVYLAAIELVDHRAPDRSWLAVGLLVSSIALMPGLGLVKRRLGERLGSATTAGEGKQNLLCAAQGAVGLLGLLAGSAGLGPLDPIAALVIALLAGREGLGLWRGEGCDCQAPLTAAPGGCSTDGCACC